MSHCVHLASDLHLGAEAAMSSVDRERAFVTWMRDAARGEGFAQGRPATELHLVGDLFDFWFEYKRAVPKGGVRLMGAIAELTDAGLPIHFHVGNHDMWTFGYLQMNWGCTFTESLWSNVGWPHLHGRPWRRPRSWRPRVQPPQARVHLSRMPGGLSLAPPRPWHGPGPSVVHAKPPKRRAAPVHRPSSKSTSMPTPWITSNAREKRPSMRSFLGIGTFPLTSPSMAMMRGTSTQVTGSPISVPWSFKTAVPN